MEQADALMLRNTQKSVTDLPHSAAGKLSLVFAIPDHPWVDSAQGAAVRIGMTVGAQTSGSGDGRLLTVHGEHSTASGEVEVQLDERSGLIHADLRTGANVAGVVALQSNAGLSSPGVKLHGAGFIVTRPEAASLGLGSVKELERHIREYRNGRDLTSTGRDVLVIDLFGLTADEARTRFPAVYQWVLDRVKPDRDANAQTKDGAGYAKYWWLHGKPRTELRPVLIDLNRYIATVETSKHRTFQFLDASILPDNMLIAVGIDDALPLGVMSSAVHVVWSLATGGTLEDRPRYNKSRCFETFPFPSDDTGLTPALTDRIRQLAEQLDVHRKARQAAHDVVTLTGMYNVLDKLRSGEALTAKDKLIHEQGLVSVLRTLHDDLDAAVLDAYGWGDLRVALGDHAPVAAEARAAAVETLLERLVALNAKRAAEEAAGTVRWLRPEFQLRQRGGEQASIETDTDEATAVPEAAATAAVAASVAKRPWPAGLPEQIKAVADVLASTPAALGIDDLASRFTARGRWRDRLPMILDTLEALGRARRDGADWRG